MGQANKIIEFLKKIYKKTVSFPALDYLVKKTLENFVKILCFFQKLSFPKKFTWEWKLEMLLRNYEKNTVKYFKENIKPGMTVIDIGAHIGYYTLIFSKLVGPNGKVFAFEPEKENFLLLEKNTCHLKNVERHEKAVSDKNGSIDFFKIIGSTGCHSVLPPQIDNEKITVESITIDSFLEKKSINKVDFLKIDIEGAELLALKGMEALIKKSKKLSVVAEFNPEGLKNSDTKPAEFLENLEKMGFKIFKISSTSIAPLDAKKGIAGIDFYHAKNAYTNILLIKNNQ